ncbi:translation factor GTPase family protein [Aminicella lysinilytica]|uniref:translation factor GTPase family protein n=1 Tax=Aminicella lysinilytica TaxID=433323 RepID=UPI0026EB4F6D|nr:TetM/TetW/TetO/TetS family tetracycline resistance ribosomal protection protein [Aminicella lysinilytica]
MKKITIGILAHVDSGKTTLSEAMLYKTGEIKALGRVDHGDSVLDGNQLERNRGITIFSKEAILEWDDIYVSLLDTPGHVDFSAEMERTLSVLDYAILVISGSDGVQSHTKTLWKLLAHYNIPTFIFVNKMDLAAGTKADLAVNLAEGLSEACVDMTSGSGETFFDDISIHSEVLTEKLLNKGTLTDDDIASAVEKREIFPCYFGSALKLDGIDELLAGLSRFTKAKTPGKDFGARVFKISRDEAGVRLTFVKITGGSVRIRDSINGEKVNSVRIYSGMKYELKDEAGQGMVCALTGLTKAKIGDGLGNEKTGDDDILEPVMTYGVVLPEGKDPNEALRQLMELAEEDPKLYIRWNDETQEINVQVMGEIQLEILKSLIMERFDFSVDFDQGKIVYKETIADTVEGVGHYEPLRHYAEVHLVLSPGERGSGLTFTTSCSEDDLDRNWQRLILSHLAEKVHRGVLTGAPVTDMKMTLAAGRASRKHTEGGDFRQATYRAVRNGLMKAENILLEPWAAYEIQVPTENVGRAMSDIQKMGGTFCEPQAGEELSTITGRGPVSELKDYQRQVNTYSRGLGRFSFSMDGYEACHDQAAVIADSDYEAERDVNNSADSIFCSHGSGDHVKWDLVEEYMDLPSVMKAADPLEDQEYVVQRAKTYSGVMATDKELMDIFERTYGPVKSRTPGNKYKVVAHTDARAVDQTPRPRKKKTPALSGPTYLLIDGYNLIHAWDELDDLAKMNFASARERLIDILCNYQGFTEYVVIVVFDAYKVKGGIESSTKVRNINVVYTKEAETADMYIERVTHQMAGKKKVRVVTSDGLEQLIIMGHGALRTSSREFVEEIRKVEKAIYDAFSQ